MSIKRISTDELRLELVDLIADLQMICAHVEEAQCLNFEVVETVRRRIMQTITNWLRKSQLMNWAQR